MFYSRFVFIFIVVLTLFHSFLSSLENNWDLLYLLKKERDISLTNEFTILLKSSSNYSKMFLTVKSLFPDNVLPPTFAIICKLKFHNRIKSRGTILSITDPDNEIRLALAIKTSPGVIDKITLNIIFHPLNGERLDRDIILPFEKLTIWTFALSVLDDKIIVYTVCEDTKRPFGYQFIKRKPQQNETFFKDGAILNLFNEGNGKNKFKGEIFEMMFSNHAGKLQLLCPKPMIEGSGNKKSRMEDESIGNVLLITEKEPLADSEDLDDAEMITSPSNGSTNPTVNYTSSDTTISLSSIKNDRIKSDLKGADIKTEKGNNKNNDVLNSKPTVASTSLPNPNVTKNISSILTSSQIVEKYNMTDVSQLVSVNKTTPFIADPTNTTIKDLTTSSMDAGEKVVPQLEHLSKITLIISDPTNTTMKGSNTTSIDVDYVTVSPQLEHLSKTTLTISDPTNTTMKGSNTTSIDVDYVTVAPQLEQLSKTTPIISDPTSTAIKSLTPDADNVKAVPQLEQVSKTPPIISDPTSTTMKGITTTGIDADNVMVRLQQSQSKTKPHTISDSTSSTTTGSTTADIRDVKVVTQQYHLNATTHTSPDSTKHTVVVNSMDNVSTNQIKLTTEHSTVMVNNMDVVTKSTSDNLRTVNKEETVVIAIESTDPVSLITNEGTTTTAATINSEMSIENVNFDVKMRTTTDFPTSVNDTNITTVNSHKIDTNKTIQYTFQGNEYKRCKVYIDQLLSMDSCEELKQLRLSIPKPGDKGAKGDFGERGEKGNIGPRGIPGTCDTSLCQSINNNTGSKGDKGDRGTCSESKCSVIKGDKGDRGERGNVGVKGEMGSPNEINVELIKHLVTTFIPSEMEGLMKNIKGAKGDPGECKNDIQKSKKQTNGQRPDFQENINIGYGSLVFENRNALEKVSFHLPLGSMVFLLKSDTFLVKVDHLNNIWRSISLESRSKDWILPVYQSTPRMESRRPMNSNGFSKKLYLVALSVPTMGDLKSTTYQPGGYSGASFQCQQNGDIYGYGRLMHPLINTDMFNMKYVIHDKYKNIPIYNARDQLLAIDFLSLLSAKDDLQNEILDFDRRSIIDNIMASCVWIGKDPIPEYRDYQQNAELKCHNWMTRHPISKALVSMVTPLKPLLSDDNIKPHACSLQCHILCIQTEPHLQ